MINIVILTDYRIKVNVSKVHNYRYLCIIELFKVYRTNLGIEFDSARLHQLIFKNLYITPIIGLQTLHSSLHKIYVDTLVLLSESLRASRCVLHHCLNCLSDKVLLSIEVRLRYLSSLVCF